MDKDQTLKEALETALDVADRDGDAVIAAKLTDCLWLLSRRPERR